jgi:VCBS repeat-containing protein
MGRFVSSAFRAAVVLSACGLFAAGPVSAIEHEVRILLDLDHDAATGCTVSTPEGAFDGVDQILATTVETTTPPPAGTVTGVSVLDCTNPVTDTFGPPVSIDGGGWPVGIDNGVGGRDVVETYFPLISSVVSSPTTVRLGVVVTDELGGARALLTTDGTPTGDPILLVIGAVIDPADIPTLGEWGLILLALVLAGASVLLLGRRGTVALGLALLFLAAGAVWAAGGLDGLTDDWSAGDQLAAGNGIVLFGKPGGDDLCFRVDVALLFDQAPTADDQAVSTDEDTPVAITLTGSDPESEPLTFSIVVGPSNGALTGTPPNVTYTPDADFTGPDSFTFQVEDPSGGTDTGTVSITVDPVNDAPVVDAATFPVDENASIGTAVGTVTFTDPDAGQSHTFAITAGNTGGAFSIGATTGEITVAAALDFETTPSYSLTVEVTDDGAPVLSGSATITVNVTDADDPPTAVDDAATVAEDDPATAIDVLANDTDTDGGPKTIQSVTQPANGTVVITGGGTGLTYEPDADACNDGTPTDDFTYTLNGGSSATVAVTVTCDDDDPQAVDDAATVAEDSGASAIDVLGNDTDVDAGAISITSVTQPTNGTVVITGGGTGLTYEPDADYCNDGSPVDTFTYTLTPGGSTATVSMTVTCDDDPPTAVDDTATVGEDSGANALPVLANDTDLDGGPISVQSVTQPTNGTVAITGGGSGVTYTPDANYCNGGVPTDDFTYTLNGGSSATVAVTVTCADDPPLAVDDTATVGEDSGANPIDVLLNDTDLDGGTKQVTVVQSPSANGGTVMITGGGTGVAYAPAANYCNAPPGTAPDIFTYTLNGGSTATVSVTVTCVDDPPAIDLDADDDQGTGGADFAVGFTENDGPTLLQDPDDPNGAIITDVDSTTLVSLTVTLTNLLDAGEELLDADVSAFTPDITKDYDTTTPGVGVLTISSLTPQPIADYVAVLRTVTYDHTGDDPDETARVIQFVANDGTSDSNTATSTVAVTAEDDDPQAVDDTATVTEDDAATTIDVLANDTDTDGGTIEIQSVSQPTNGTVVITNSGADLTYEPDPDYCNDGFPTDDFTYTLNGGSTATVEVTVTCADDPPTAVNDAATVGEDSGTTAIPVLTNDTDPDGGLKEIQSVTQAGDGTVVITGGGTGLTYEPDADYCNDGSPTDDFTYTLNGGSSATVAVTVTCVDDDPVAVADAATVVEDSGANAIDVLANDTDVDGGPISVQSVTQPTGGTVAITGGGTGVSYTPNANFCNDGTPTDDFTYTLNGGSSTTVAVTVTCVDDPPVAVADAAMVNEDSGANAIPVLANDTDIDGGPKTVQMVTQPGNGTVVITGGGTGLTYAPNLNYCNDGSPTDDFTYTLNGGSSTTVMVTVVCINDPPVAGNDSFDFIGNTELRVDSGATASPHALETTGSGFGLLDNDSDPVENDPIFISAITGCADGTAPFDCTVAGVGTFHVESNGQFTFVPLPGDTDASEMIIYTLSDGTDTVNGTVTLNRTQRVWYVQNNTATAGTAGTSVDPFDTLVEAQTASLANDYIFVYRGNDTATGQNAGIALKSGQHLLGQHVGLSIPVSLNGNGSPTVLVPATAGRPLLGDTAAGGPEGVSAVDVIPAEVAGLSLSGNVNAIEWTTTGAFAGTGTFEIRDNVVTGAAAIGVDINLAGTGATRLSFHDNAITATGTGLNVQETGAGALTITAFDDNSVSGATGGSGMIVSNAIFDAVPGGGFDLVAGGTTAIGSPGNGVGGAGLTMGGVSGDLLFTDLDVFADAGAAISVAGTGPSNLAGGTGLRFRVGAGVGMAVAAGGPAVSLTNLTADLQLSSLTSTGSTTTGVSLTGVTDGGGIDAVFTTGAGSAITLAGGTSAAFLVSGGNVRIAYGGTIVNNASGANAVSISSWAGDDASDDLVLSGSIDENGAGIRIQNNAGSRAITFSGGLDVDTTGATAEGFVATGNTNSLGLHVTGSSNDIDSVSATALRVTNTTIGSSHLNFRRVSSGNNTGAADPVNGIVLTNTGTSGSLKITGTGGAGTGGTIQSTSGHAIELTNTLHPQLAWMNLQNIGRNGIDGQQVTDFTFSNSTINNVGTAAAGQYDESNIAFNDGGAFTASSLSGTVSITNNTLTNARRHGIQIENGTGTIANLTISNNTLTSSTSAAQSLGNGILILTQGSAATTSHLTTGSISNNTISRFPSGAGILVGGGSGSSTNNTSATLGAGGTPINVTGNFIAGQSAGNRMGTNAIQVSFNGQNGVSNFNISGNGTVGNPLRNYAGIGITVFMGGSVTGSTTVSNNVLTSNNTAASSGIAVQADDGPAGAGTSAANVNFTINGNNVSANEGFGIRAIARASLAVMDLTIQNNTVAAPTVANRNGIRVDSGSAAGDVTLCMAMSGNTSAGSGVNQGIGLRKQGNVATTNDFGIVGLAPSPTTGANAAAKVAADNPAGGGVDIINGDNFVSCTITP